MKKIKIKVEKDPLSIIKEDNEQRVNRINNSRRLGTQIIPNKKKLSRNQLKANLHRDLKD